MISQGPIIACSTGVPTGAVALLRLSGSDILPLFLSTFRQRKGNQPAELAHGKATVGAIYQDDEWVDEVIATYFQGPHSFTGEDVIEIGCHASPYIIQKLLGLYQQKGVLLAQPGEFTLRAYLNKKMDLAQAEAVADLIASESKAAHEIAQNQMRGGYSSHMKELRQELLDFTSLLTLELDFAEEDVAFADRTAFLALIAKIKTHLDKLIQSFGYGNALKKGIPIALVGKPNAGKSSLLNALLEEERALVTPIAGTTRDTVEDTLVIDGYPFRLIDTAGLRETDDLVEALGVERAKKELKKAQIVLLIYDPADTTAVELEQLLLEVKTPDNSVICIENKIDLHPEALRASFQQKIAPLLASSPLHHLPMSTRTTTGISELKRLLLRITTDQKQQFGDTVVSNARHTSALQTALAALEEVEMGFQNNIPTDLIAIDLNEALEALGSITGTFTTDELLGNIFANFCIGK
ncbi:MAG: tRNA uridine-5-carboxymethylaminomethyl(34) synthesis GTPase MnmE [Flavobacteriaceae bacterium]